MREFQRGAVRLHILHHAAEGEIHGAWMTEELAHHGYQISPGTLYPTLHRLEADGLLISEQRIVDGAPDASTPPPKPAARHWPRTAEHWPNWHARCWATTPPQDGLTAASTHVRAATAPTFWVRGMRLEVPACAVPPRGNPLTK